MDCTQTPQRNQWYVACRSHQVSSRKPLRVLFWGMPIVLFRTETRVVAMLDRCPHRGAPLSQGWIAKGTIHCPYHGWQFDDKGQCQENPAACHAGGYAKIRIPTFAALEQDQWIWLRPQGTESMPIAPPPRVPGLGQPGYKAFTMDCQISGHLFNIIENFLDATHTHYVHRGLIRSPASRRDITVRIQRNGPMVEAFYENERLDRGLISQLLSFGAREVRGIGRFIGPSVAQLEFTTDNGYELYFTVPVTPVKDFRIKAWVTISYRGPAPQWLAKLLVRPFLKKALHQDLRIIKAVEENIREQQNKEICISPLDILAPHILDIWKYPDSQKKTQKYIQMRI